MPIDQRHPALGHHAHPRLSQRRDVSKEMRHRDAFSRKTSAPTPTQPPEHLDAAGIAKLIHDYPSWFLVGDARELASIDQSDRVALLGAAVLWFIVDAGLFPPPDELIDAINTATPTGPVLLMFPDKDTRRRMKACLFGTAVSTREGRA
jgi:hypothetical protein